MTEKKLKKEYERKKERERGRRGGGGGAREKERRMDILQSRTEVKFLPDIEKEAGGRETRTPREPGVQVQAEQLKHWQSNDYPARILRYGMRSVTGRPSVSIL